MTSLISYIEAANYVFTKTDYNGYYDVVKDKGMLSCVHTMCNYCVINYHLKTDDKVLVLDRGGNILEKNFELM